MSPRTSPLQPVPPVNRRTTSLPKRRATKCTLRITLLLCVAITFPVYLLNLYHIQEWVGIFLPVVMPTDINSGIHCVKSIGTTEGGIAEFVSYHQLAIFIANTRLARLAFTPMKGTHPPFMGAFDNCLPPSTRCTIRESDVNNLNCPPGDCACLAIKLGAYLNPRAACPVLGVLNNGRKSHQFSGCLRNTLRRYFTISTRWPRPYDVVQYVDRAIESDLTLLPDGQAYTNERFEKLMHAMCVMSDREIIVITDHAPTIPLCGNRTVLARVTDEQALMISSYAVHLSVTGGPLGRLMMEMSTASRVILLSEVQKWFLWVKNPDMTLVRKDGRMLHMKSAVLDENVEKELEEIELETQPEINLHASDNPKRRWEDEAVPFQDQVVGDTLGIDAHGY